MKKKIKIINNPSSGKTVGKKKLDEVIKILVNKGHTISMYNTQKKYDAKNETIKTCKEDWDIIIASGGDGTVNEVANGIALSESKVPVAIFATGTVNDFSNYVGMPKDPKGFCELIEAYNIIDVDLGKVNDKYFVNVVSGGMFSSVAHTVPTETKSIFGKAAYYVEAIKGVPKQINSEIKISVESEEFTGEEEVSLFLVTNSSSVGGFKKLAPYADIQDGYLDCVIIGKTEVQDLLPLFINILNGKHTGSSGVRYFKTKSIKVSLRSENNIHIDADGEFIGELPISIKTVPGAFKILVP